MSRLWSSTRRLSCLLYVAALPAYPITLKIAEQITAPGSDNQFVTLRNVATEPADPDQPSDSRKYITYAETNSDPDTGYVLALKSIEAETIGRFFRYAFVLWKKGQPAKTQVLVHVTSTGKFSDFTKDIPFNIDDGGETTSGILPWVPFHPFDPVDSCTAVDLPTKEKPARVFLSGESRRLAVRLSCDAAFTPPRIVSIPKEASANNKYWKEIPLQSSSKADPPWLATSKTFALLDAAATPNVLDAATARLRREKVEDPDDTIAFEIGYAIPPGGREQRLKIEIPITFYPSPYLTAASLFVGVLLGWLVTVLLLLATRRDKRWRVVAGGFLLGFVLAVIVYVLGLIAYGANCRLSLFGVELNPSDVLQLVILGVVCGIAALLKVEAMLRWIDSMFSRTTLSRAATPLVVLALLPLFPGRLPAEERRAGFVGLAGCPGMNVVGINRNGVVIEFSTANPGAWRPAGEIKELTAGEITCATLDGTRTALIVAMSVGRIWLIRMDLATGSWRPSLIGKGSSGGVAFDPDRQDVFVSSVSDRMVYRTERALGRPAQWRSVFDSPGGITALAVDRHGQRLLIAEPFAGIVYSLPLESPRQTTVARGLGTVNSFAIDAARRLLYVADRARRSIWVLRLDTEGEITPRVFYKAPALRDVTGVAVDAQSNVWTAISTDSRVVVLGPDGKERGVIP